MNRTEPQDKTYTAAVGRALGRFYADIFKGMVAGGMERSEATEVIVHIAEATVYAGVEAAAHAASEEEEE